MASAGATNRECTPDEFQGATERAIPIDTTTWQPLPAPSKLSSYRQSRAEKLREREVNYENSILLGKMLDIIKRRR